MCPGCSGSTLEPCTSWLCWKVDTCPQTTIIWFFSCVDPSYVFNSSIRLNALSHLGQANGFSPGWSQSSVFKSPLCLNALWHLEQANDICAVWILFFLQLITPFECLFTFRAGKWLLSCVDPSMCLQITTLLECIVTFGAGKWLLSYVKPFICLQLITLFECRAGQWLLSCVDPLMCLQITTPMNDLSHLEQANAFSTVWILSFFFESPVW